MTTQVPPEQPAHDTTAWSDLLRACGYRVTPQRQLVLQAVEQLDHATPETILAEVQRTAAGVNLSTVYRTLDVLEQVGLVTHAHIGHGSPAYHSINEHRHIHLVCARCKKVQSVDAAVATPFAATLQELTGFRTDVSHVSVHGVCADCTAAADA